MIFIEWETIQARCCASCKMLDIGGYCAHHGKDVNEIIKISASSNFMVIDCKFKEKV